MSTISSLENSDNDSGSSALTHASDWKQAVDFLADAKQAVAPFRGLFRQEQTSTTSNSIEGAGDIKTSIANDSGQGKAPAYKKDSKKQKNQKKKGERFRLEVVGSSATQGEKGKEKGAGGGEEGKEGEKGELPPVKLTDEQLYVIQMLFKANRERYADGAFTEERLMEMMGKTAKIELTPALADPPPSPESAEGEYPPPALSTHQIPTEEEIFEGAVRHLGLDLTDFDCTGKPKVDLCHATPAQLIVEGEHVKMLGKVEGIVSGTLAIIQENCSMDDTYRRANVRWLEEKKAEGMKEGWEEVMIGRQQEWEALTPEERRAEEHKKAVAEAQLRLERGEKLRENVRGAWEKTKAAGKQFFKAYGKDALKVAFVFGIKAALEKFGADEPERIMKEVLGLGMAMNAVGLTGDVGDG